MNKFYLSIIVLFMTAATCFAQDVTYEQIEKEYSAFHYDEALKLSDELIQKGGISDSLLIKVYTMRADLFFRKPDITNVRESFLEILKRNQDFTLAPKSYPPNLIAIFDDVKSNYIASLTPQTKNDSTQIQVPAKVFDSVKFGNSAALNLFIPGIGQINAGNQTKGIILTAASTLTLGSMIYAITNSNKKENDYLKESNKNLIQAKYDAYNSAYKTRNILIITYAAIWAFSQIDFILNSGGNTFIKENTSLNNEKLQSDYSQISLGFSIPLK